MHLKRGKTINISDALSESLSDRGLTPVEIPRLIKDVYNIVDDGGNFTVTSVNEALELLGWREKIMDAITFELVLFLLEIEDDYGVERNTFH